MFKNSLEATEFRGFPDGYQFRRQLCKEFIRFLAPSSDIEVLLIEARPGIGATSICAEYLETLEDPAILLTVHAGSRAGYSIPYLLEQALRQARLILNDVSSAPYSDNYVVEWHKTLMKLQRRARSTRRKLHLILDGLYQVPPEDGRHLQDVIKEVLFLGSPDIRHIVTWREEPKIPEFLARFSVRRASLPPLSEFEALTYLKVCGIDDSWAKEIISSTECVPAKLASVVRLNRLGRLDIRQLGVSLVEYYELEWNAQLDRKLVTRQDAERIFAFLVFSKRQLTVLELMTFCGVGATSLRAVLDANGFVRVDVNDHVAFTSNTHRDFLQVKLTSYRTEVLSTFVDALIKDASSPDSVQLLPNYYEDLGRDSDIVAILTPLNLDSYLAETQSLTALRRRNELGFSAATRSSLEVEAFRFALQTSIVRSLEKHGGNDAQLGALAATGRLDDALDIAQGASTKEGRLLLLAQYAKALFDKGLQVDKVIADIISGLIADIDLSTSRERSLTIAEYLVGPFPDLSIVIVEQSSAGAKDYQDAAFAHLVLKTQSRAGEGQRISSERYRSRIADSQLRDFLRSVEAVFGAKSAEEIRQSTQGLDGRQRSFLLRGWIRVHAREEGALDIADYALDEVSRDSSYIPSAADLRVICLPIADSEDRTKAHALLRRIEVQQSALLEVTPTVDKFRLETEIARAKTAMALANHDDELSDLYLRAGYLEDDGVRLECFCWMRSALESFKNVPGAVIDNFRHLFDEAIHDATEKCLATTAEHLDVFKGAVAALAESSPAQALALVGKLNTIDRRDAANRLFVERLIGRRSKAPIEVSLLIEALNAIVSDEARWPAIVNCLSLLAKRKPSLDKPPVEIIAMGISIDDPLGRAYALLWSVTVGKHYGVQESLGNAVTSFRDTLGEIDQVWKLPELNFRFVEAIAAIDKVAASKWLTEYHATSRKGRYWSPEFAKLFSELCHLTLISYAGTLTHRLDTDETFATVVSLIDEAPSVGVRARLYADLVMRAHAKARGDIVEKVCGSRLIPLIRNVENGTLYLHKQIAGDSYAALYLWNQTVANNLIQELPRERQDECRQEAVFYHVTGVTTQEPYEVATLRGCKISWATAVTIVELIEKMSVDHLIVSCIEYLTHSALSKASISEISSSQRSTLGGRLLEKVMRDLPDVRNIKHKGWQIVAEAFCYKLMGETSTGKWNVLIANAKAVPNTSDSVFVLSSIAPCLPGRLSTEKAEIMREAELRLKRIPSNVDRVRRSISLSISSHSAEMEDVIAKRLLTSAMNDSLTLRDQDAAADAQRAIIDLAYQIDKEFAEGLVKLIDDDPARVRARAEAEANLDAQRMKRAVLDKKYDDIGQNVDGIGAICWQMLAGLNANRMPPQRQDELANLMGIVSRCDFTDALGFYWWYLRNLQCKYEHNKPQSKAILVPMFEVTRLAAMLTQRIGVRVFGGWNVNVAPDSSPSSSAIVGPGLGVTALDFIKNWLDQNDGAEILLCDPYFKIENLEFVKELSFHKAGLSFVILSCAIEPATGDLEADYEAAWGRVAHVQPPPLRVVHVSFDGPKSVSPIHDRWLLFGDAGLRMGTSVGSLGGTKLSEVSKVAANDVSSVRRALQPFIEMRERSLDGRRLKYRSFQW